MAFCGITAQRAVEGHLHCIMHLEDRLRLQVCLPDKPTPCTSFMCLAGVVSCTCALGIQGLMWLSQCCACHVTLLLSTVDLAASSVFIRWSRLCCYHHHTTYTAVGLATVRTYVDLVLLTLTLTCLPPCGLSAAIPPSSGRWFPIDKYHYSKVVLTGLCV
jgi:hypothetical protein